MTWLIVALVVVLSMAALFGVAVFLGRAIALSNDAEEWED